MRTTLLIARHGNTFSPGDIVTRVGARTDLPLVPSGLEQGRKLGLYLKEKGLSPDAVFTSNLKRTRQTAEQVFEAGGFSLPIGVNPLFNEIDYGIDENKPEADVVARVGADALKAWDENAVVPNGWQVDVQAIIQGWLHFGATCVQDYAGKKILVVTSNGIARFAPYLTGDFDGFRRDHKLKISTGALAILAHENGSWKVEGWNLKP